jgi:hypothetical protein
LKKTAGKKFRWFFTPFFWRGTGQPGPAQPSLAKPSPAQEP